MREPKAETDAIPDPHTPLLKEVIELTDGRYLILYSRSGSDSAIALI